MPIGDLKSINEKILKSACEELNTISDISVRMEYIRQNKKVTEVLLHVTKEASLLEKPVALDLTSAEEGSPDLNFRYGPKSRLICPCH